MAGVTVAVERPEAARTCGDTHSQEARGCRRCAVQPSTPPRQCNSICASAAVRARERRCSARRARGWTRRRLRVRPSRPTPKTNSASRLSPMNFPRPPPVSQVLGPWLREQPLQHVDRHSLTVSRTAAAREYSRVAACRRLTMRALDCDLLLWCRAHFGERADTRGNPSRPAKGTLLLQRSTSTSTRKDAKL